LLSRLLIPIPPFPLGALHPGCWLFRELRSFRFVDDIVSARDGALARDGGLGAVGRDTRLGADGVDGLDGALGGDGALGPEDGPLDACALLSSVNAGLQ